MNRNKRTKLVRQRKEANDAGKAELDKLRDRGFYKGQNNPLEQVSGQDLQNLLEYMGSLEERIKALESALNLDINI